MSNCVHVRSSFQNVKSWLDEIDKYAGENVCKVSGLRKDSVEFYLSACYFVVARWEQERSC
jgi:hypothetical protein